MFKYLLPFLFIFGSVDASTLSEQKDIPPIVKKITIPVRECFTDLDALSKKLFNDGYKLLIESKDKANDKITRDILYNFSTNEIVFETFVGVDKTCIEYIGSNPIIEGDVLKEFVTHQVIDHRNEVFKKKSKDE